MRIVKLFFMALGLAAVVWLVGLIWFAATLMPQTVADTDTKTDAIVVLTGGSERLDTGVELLRAERGKAMFISGVDAKVKAEALFNGLDVTETAIKVKIALGHMAGDTTGNAYETAAWMRSRGYSTLRLVTASYHMPRSILELQSALPEALIIPHPVFPDRVKQSDWWRWPGTTSLIAREYSKFLVAHVRIWLHGLIR